MNHLPNQNPDLKLVLCADGAKDNWTFSKSLNLDAQMLDFWHAAEDIKVAAEPLMDPMKWPVPNGLKPSAIFFATIPRVPTER